MFKNILNNISSNENKLNFYRKRKLSSLRLMMGTSLFCLSMVYLPSSHALPQSHPDTEKQDHTQKKQAEEEKDQVIVTGTRRKGRTVTQSTAPIDYISASDIAHQGLTETNQLLSSEVPSFNFPLPSVTDGTDHVRPATLRGLAPDHTLVLINGKRRHTSALLNVNGSIGRGSSAVDLNAIPTIAIQSIEVLRDGAAAQYGSDAIAGVLNLKLKDANEGITLSANYGQYNTSVDGVKEVVGVKKDSTGQPMLDAQGNYILERIGNAERQDGETLTLSGNAGLPLGENGFFNISGEFRNRKPTNRAGYDPRQQYNFLGNGDADPREFTFNRLNHRYGNAGVTDTTLFYNAALPLSSIELYSFGSFQKRDGKSPAFYRRSRDSRNTISIYPDGFLPRITADIIDYSFAGGARGVISEWDWDASLVYGYDKFNFGVQNSLNTSFGETSQTAFNAGTLIFKQIVGNFDLNREFTLPLLSNPVSTAFGIEYRVEDYRIKAGEPSSYTTAILRDMNGDPILNSNGKQQPAGAGGSQAFPGFQPSNAISGSRNALGFYAEFDTDIIDAWNVIAALRYERYSDFGSKLSWKLATRYEINDYLAARATLSTGFRAPSLAQQYYTTTSTVFEDGEPFEVGTFPVGSLIAKTLGATPLNAEESFNISTGIVATFDNGLNITLDVYQIKIDNRIVLTENLPESVVMPILEANGINGVQRARFFINGINTKTTGIDLVGSYKLQTKRYGDFRFSAGFNYNKTDITDSIAQVGPLSKLEPEMLFSRRERLRFEKGTPKSRINFTTNWNLNNFGATLRINQYGETLDPGTLISKDEYLSAKWLTDLEVRYTFNNYVNLALGANNIFDTYPDLTPTGKRSDGKYHSVFNQIFPYSGFSPFGFYGRYLYAKVNVTF